MFPNFSRPIKSFQGYLKASDVISELFQDPRDQLEIISDWSRGLQDRLKITPWFSRSLQGYQIVSKALRFPNILLFDSIRFYRK